MESDLESEMESRNRSSSLADSGKEFLQALNSKEFSQEKENPSQEVAKGLDWGTGI